MARRLVVSLAMLISTGRPPATIFVRYYLTVGRESPESRRIRVRASATAEALTGTLARV